MSELPKIKELPYFKIQANAGIKLLRNAKTKLIDSPQPKKTDQLDEIAKPIAYNLCLLPTLKSKQEISVLLKIHSFLMLFCWRRRYFTAHPVHVFLPQFRSISQPYTKFPKTKQGLFQPKPVLSVNTDKTDITDNL